MSHKHSMLPDIPARVSYPGMGDTLAEDEEVLQRHVLRVQETLMDAVDKRVKTFEGKLREKDSLLKNTLDDKHNLAIELYRAQNQVEKLNESLGTINNKLSSFQTDKSLENSARVHLERNLQDALKNKTQVEKELQQARKEAAEFTGQLSQLGQMNTVFSADLRIQRKVQQNLKKDIERIEGRRKVMELELVMTNKNVEKIQHEKREVEQALSLQSHEAMIAQNAINNMTRELQDLKQNKELLEKQWEDAIAAMTKRDTAFQKVSSNADKAKEELKHIESRSKALVLDKDKAIKELRKKELDNTHLNESVETLKSGLTAMEIKAKNLQSEIEEAKLGEARYCEKVKSLTQEKKLMSEKLTRKSQQVETLKSKLHQAATDINTKSKDEISVIIAIKEEHMVHELETKIARAEKGHDLHNVELRQKNAQLKMLLLQKNDIIATLQTESSHTKSRYSEVNTHYFKLYEQSRMMVGDIERKEHDINLLKSKMSDRVSKEPTTSKSQADIVRLNAELRQAKAEKERLHILWLESQKENLKSKGKLEQLDSDNEYLKTQLGITDTIKLKTVSEIDEARKQTIEHKLENSRYFLELKHLKPEMEELRRKNELLEKQVAEANFAAQSISLEGKTAVQMLKQEVRRLYDERKGMRKDRLTDSKSNSSIEKKHQLSIEMLEKLRIDTHSLQKQNVVLRTKLDESQGKYLAVKIEYKKYQELTARQTESKIHEQSKLQSAAQVKNISTRPGWSSFATTPGGVQDGKTKKPAGTFAPITPTTSTRLMSPNLFQDPASEFEIPDLHAMRLKLNSLLTEKDYLMNENVILKTTNTESQRRISQLETKIMNLQAQKVKLESDIHQNFDNITNFRDRLLKAQQIAAFIETQFKEAKPNVKIDYIVVTELEPSTQLLAALMGNTNSSSHA